MQNSQPAMDACNREWDRLQHKGVWDITTVREWKAVAREARDAGDDVHMGRLFGLCVEKNSELVSGDPRRKYKYRVVFGGHAVIDQCWEAAVFQDLGSGPATMEAGKYVDFYSCLPGHAGQQADAEQAYIQSDHIGLKTWVVLPKDKWPSEWNGKYTCPVVVLRKALNGHPDSGTSWEKHCNSALNSVGFEQIYDWSSLFYHKTLKLLLCVYVDDFKLAGPARNLSEGWKAIRSCLKTENPSELNLYLGCIHRPFEAVAPVRESPDGTSPKDECTSTVRGIEYDMEDFLRQCVDRYCELAKQSDGKQSRSNT